MEIGVRAFPFPYPAAPVPVPFLFSLLSGSFYLMSAKHKLCCTKLNSNKMPSQNYSHHMFLTNLSLIARNYRQTHSKLINAPGTRQTGHKMNTEVLTFYPFYVGSCLYRQFCLIVCTEILLALDSKVVFLGRL